MDIEIKKMRNSSLIPEYGTLMSGGADLHACITDSVKIKRNRTVMIPTGIALSIPEGYVGLVYARSGLSCKEDLAPANKVGVIDADFRGEIFVALHNHGRKKRVIQPSQRIAQIIFQKCEKANFLVVDELDDTQRGEGMLGSTGKV